MWVASAAGAAWPAAEPTDAEVCISKTNYFTGPIADVDNIVKPIQDALQRVVYFVDDRQVTDVLSQKRSLAATLWIGHADRAVQTALEAGDDFVHVTISLSSDSHFAL